MAFPFNQRLERFLERFAVPGLIRYVALFNALVFVLHLLAPGYTSVLALDPTLVLQGQVWRLVTWIFIPETLSPFWIFFSLLFLLYLGDGLESAVGPAKLTLFYTCGVIFCTTVSFLFALSGDGGAVLTRANTFLNLSLLLAFATAYPDFKVLVFFCPARPNHLASSFQCGSHDPLILGPASGRGGNLRRRIFQLLSLFWRGIARTLPWFRKTRQGFRNHQKNYFTAAPISRIPAPMREVWTH